MANGKNERSTHGGTSLSSPLSVYFRSAGKLCADTDNNKETQKEWGATVPTPKTTSELGRSEEQLRRQRKQQVNLEGVRSYYCADAENKKETRKEWGDSEGVRNYCPIA